MNKWRWLLLIILCWMVAGLALSYPLQRQQSQVPPLPTRADRIVSMAPSLTEILFALGLEKDIVGVTQYSDYPAAAKEKPKVGSFWQPNIEAVVAAKPSLVILLGFPQQKNLAECLKRIGYNTLTVNVETVNDLFEATAEIGTATGRQRQASELISSIKGKLQALSRLVGDGAKVKVLWVVQREPLRVAGRNTFVNEMIELAGGENAIGPTVHKYPPIGAEQVIISRPEVIIEPDMGQEDLAAQRDAALRYWSKYKSVPAVTNGRVYVIRGGAVSRLGPRLYEGTETIARCLRPHLFEN
jgi:iron complex transport system substrate-binding protein